MASTTDASVADWVKTQFGSLYHRSAPREFEEEAFQPSFDTLFAPQAHIVVNHESTTREQLREMVQLRLSAATGTEIEWKNVMEIPKEDDDAHPPAHWHTAKSIMSLPHGGSMAKLKEMLKGGWRDVPQEERWWDAALQGSVEERRIKGLQVLQQLRAGITDVRDL